MTACVVCVFGVFEPISLYLLGVYEQISVCIVCVLCVYGWRAGLWMRVFNGAETCASVLSL